MGSEECAGFSAYALARERPKGSPFAKGELSPVPRTGD